MRPRVFPAEDGVRHRGEVGVAYRFNEAAGIPRGRPAPDVAGEQHFRASMRPRVFPAEDNCMGRLVKLSLP